jgi:hypothetical protein
MLCKKRTFGSWLTILEYPTMAQYQGLSESCQHQSEYLLPDIPPACLFPNHGTIENGGIRPGGALSLDDTRRMIEKYIVTLQSSDDPLPSARSPRLTNGPAGVFLEARECRIIHLILLLLKKLTPFKKYLAVNSGRISCGKKFISLRHPTTNEMKSFAISSKV